LTRVGHGQGRWPGGKLNRNARTVKVAHTFPPAPQQVRRKPDHVPDERYLLTGRPRRGGR